MSLTRVRAKSCDMRCSAGVSSSKKLVTSRETWYCCAERVVLVLKKNAPGVVGERDFHGDRDHGAGDASALRVIGERRGLRGDYRAFEHGVSRSAVRH